MTYDHEVTLIKNKTTYDDIGNPITQQERTTVLCKLSSVGTNEFYQASAQGLKPDIEFTIHGYEYDGQSEVVFQGDEYKVIRTYRKDFEEIELTCQRTVGS